MGFTPTAFIVCHFGRLQTHNHYPRQCLQRSLTSSFINPTRFTPRILPYRQNVQKQESYTYKKVLPTASALVNRTVLNTSLTAVAKLLVTLALGVAAAYRGVLDPQTLSALSKVVYNVFLPSLLFTNVVYTLASPTLPQGLFLLPLGAVLQVIFGLIFGLVGARILRLTRQERHIYLVSTAFGNSAALPLLFATALFANSPSLPQLIAPLSFFLIGWTGLFWSYARHLLSTMSTPLPVSDPPATAPASSKNLSETVSKVLSFLKQVATPPLLGSFFGLALGLIRPARIMFMASPFFAALATLGAGYGPSAVLILAGSLARPPPPKSTSSLPTSPSSESQNDIPLRIWRMVAGISLTRFVCMPVIAMLMVKYGPFRAPFVAFALLLESVMPSAQNSTLILNMQKRHKDASSVASILLIVYLVGVVPISVALTVFLAATGIS